MKKLRGLFRVVFGRTAFVILFLLIQVGILFGVIRWLGDYLIYAYGLALIITSFAVIYILNARENASFKMAWIIPVLVFPVFGVLFFLFMHVQLRTRILKLRLKMTRKMAAPCLTQNAAVTDRLAKDDPSQFRLAGYMNRWAGFPVYENTSVCHFPLGEDKFEALKRELRAAKEFIFMEYFIVEEGIMWNTILEILKRKAAEGVEVRFMYDGMCAFDLLPYSYPKKLQKYGINCKMSNKIRPFVSTIQNNRDHRKICVIDGQVGYVGGVNLADEYINEKERFGHWKDTALRLEGEGVWGLTSIFLEMWEVAMGYEITTDYTVYMPTVKMPSDGFVQPFCDGPANNPNNPAEDVYTHLINKARDYVYITTPYLVIDRKMTEDLCRTARSGVDVKIIVPHIYDKWYVYMVNVANYGPLIANGVHVYEYMPGFIHSKTVVCDDECAVCGTINMDYRSFYLHYECGVFTCESSAVADIRDDIHETLKQCQEIYLDEWQSRPWYEKIIQWVLRLFAPVL